MGCGVIACGEVTTLPHGVTRALSQALVLQSDVPWSSGAPDPALGAGVTGQRKLLVPALRCFLSRGGARPPHTDLRLQRIEDGVRGGPQEEKGHHGSALPPKEVPLPPAAGFAQMQEGGRSKQGGVGTKMCCRRREPGRDQPLNTGQRASRWSKETGLEEHAKAVPQPPPPHPCSREATRKLLGVERGCDRGMARPSIPNMCL